MTFLLHFFLLNFGHPVHHFCPMMCLLLVYWKMSSQFFKLFKENWSVTFLLLSALVTFLLRSVFLFNFYFLGSCLVIYFAVPENDILFSSFNIFYEQGVETTASASFIQQSDVFTWLHPRREIPADKEFILYLKCWMLREAAHLLCIWTNEQPCKWKVEADLNCVHAWVCIYNKLSGICRGVDRWLWNAKERLEELDLDRR